MAIQYKNHALGRITLSIGVACFPDHGQTSEELLKAADLCLYESKSAGRDKVSVATRGSGDREMTDKSG
jgi:diguanylate cyclase (GGDEF)-like protein